MLLYLKLPIHYNHNIQIVITIQQQHKSLHINIAINSAYATHNQSNAGSNLTESELNQTNKSHKFDSTMKLKQNIIQLEIIDGK